MSIPARLVGLDGKLAKVNDSGELVISVGGYDQTKFVELDVAGAIYNFYEPINNRQFIVTGFLAYADKQVSSSTNTTVTIFEASTISGDLANDDDIIFKFELGQNQSTLFPNLKVLTKHGSYINAKCDDDDVHLTIIGNYRDRID